MRRRFLFNKNIEKSLVITANEPSTVTFNVYAVGTCEYNLNNTGWVKYTSTLHSLNAGETISFRGDLSISTTALDEGVGRFIIDGNVDLYGSPIYLLAGQFLQERVFYSLFESCDIRNVSSTFLPVTTLTSCCYEKMFAGCTSLTTAPELPSTALARYCYSYMFYGCTNLVNASALPATTLANGCYSSMFKGCTALITAPELPATTLASECYYSMFNGCSNLNYIKMLATDISATNCFNLWVSRVSSTGTFVKNSAMNSLPTGSSGIPSGWTVVDDGEESGVGKIENYLRKGKTSITMQALTLDFPAETTLDVHYTDSRSNSRKSFFPKGSSTLSIGLGPGESIVSVDRLNPNEDDVYIYKIDYK